MGKPRGGWEDRGGEGEVALPERTSGGDNGRNQIPGGKKKKRQQGVGGGVCFFPSKTEKKKEKTREESPFS